MDLLKTLLEDFKAGHTALDEVLAAVRRSPYEELGFAKVDHHRALRSGFPEVVFCQGKSIPQIVAIFNALEARNDRLLLTRADRSVFEALQPLCPELQWHPEARLIALNRNPAEPQGAVTVICAGTADIPVAEESAITAEICGAKVTRVFDAGVAGLHRLLDHLDALQRARCIVCLAGMEGALPSVVGGLAPCPVIAVPTSIGYGTHLNGLVPLLGMLNSCASNVTVVNIDNGFSAGYIAALINRTGG